MEGAGGGGGKLVKFSLIQIWLLKISIQPISILISGILFTRASLRESLTL